MKILVSSSALKRSRRALGKAVRHLVVGFSAITGSVSAASFTPGNLVVYRVGDGSTGLVNTGSPVFIDEYTPAGTLVQSISLPTTVSGANKRVIASGTAGSEGLITRSGDGNYLLATGYDAPMPTTSLTGTASTAVNRVVARIAGDGTVDSSTALTDAATGNNIRGVFSTNGTDIWTTGGGGGVRYTTLGGTTSVQLSTTQANIRGVAVVGSQLFVTSGSGTNTTRGVNAVGTGTPTTSGQTITRLAGLTDTNCPSTYGFFFADLDAGVAGADTLYVSDDGVGALTKFSLVTGTWTSNGTVGVDTDDYRGLTGIVNSGVVTLYATRKGGAAAAGGGELVSISDSSGYNAPFTGTPTLLATAAVNTAFRGVAFAPAAPVSTPTVTIAATDAAAAESPADAGTFRITRTGDTTNPMTVNYTISTGAGQAVAGDYTPALTGSATILAAQTFVDVTITPVDDTVLEGDETVTLTITDAVDYDLGATATASVTIDDNETAIDLSRYVRVGRYDLPVSTVGDYALQCREASAVTYNWDTDTLFITGDGGTSVVQVSKTGTLINFMTLATGGSPQGTEFYDTEGITYIGGGQFVMTEERDRQLFKFTYAGGTTLGAGGAQRVKLGTTIGNIGLEGLSYDPQTSGFIVLKEKDPRGIFQTGVDFGAGTATNGSPTTVNSTDLFSPVLLSVLDHSDIFALSNLPALNGKPTTSHLILLSQESGQILHVDRSGAVSSTLTIVADVGSPLTVPDMTMEGVTMDRDGFLYVVNENGGGDANHPQLWVYAPSNATNVAPTAITLSGVVNSLPETTNTSAAVKVANISITDDGLGANTLSVSGTDASSFEIIGTALFLKAGTVLNATTKPSYSITVNVDDTTVGGTPDTTTNYALTITTGSGSGTLIISEVAPWSSTNGLGLTADWFEVTNTGTAAVDITGWKVDDNGPTFATAIALSGITSIAAGESVIFIETSGTQTNSGNAANFRTLWFGASPPLGLQIGSYSGSGIGLSSGGDSVNLFNAGGTIVTSVSFGASPGGPFPTFDNAAGITGLPISTLSVVGTNGAFNASGDANEIGSPGTIATSSTPIISITAVDPNAAEELTNTGTFRITRTGSTASSLTVNFTVATGAGQADAADYTPAIGTSATIGASQTFVDVVITPVDDASIEGSETVSLTLFDTGSYDVGSPASAIVTITDNDVNLAPTAVVFGNTVTSLVENTSTAADVRVADITITDDGNGTNDLSLSGADAASFVITGNSLYLKAGTTLSYTTKPTYNVTVNVDDTTVGSTPDATANFVLNITQFIAPGTIIISEVSPWSSTVANSPLAADWFEVKNTGATAVNIAGWKVDDNSHAFGSALLLNGITSIAPGESVIFIESAAPATIAATFRNLWFGANPPTGLQIGTYTGSGIGLGSTGDEVVLFNASGSIVTGVAFGASPTVAPFTTFDNAAGAGGTVVGSFPTLATPSVIGTNGAFAALTDVNEIGSPGTTTTSTFSFASATYSVSEAAGTVTLTVNRTGSTAAATVLVSTANGTATAGSDYTALSSTPVAFALNDMTKTVVANVTFRPGIQGSRTFTAALSGATTTSPATTTVTITESDTFAASTGPSSSATPYVLPLNGNWQTKALLTVGDGPGGYQMVGIPDGLGAYDNGDGTITLLMNHELGKTVGATRAHGAIGSFVSQWVINKSTLAVTSGSDLMTTVYNWNSTTQVSDAAPSTVTFSRFCSADLPPVSAFYNAATGLGTQTRIFMNGEESTGGGTNGLGYVVGHVATGADKGKSYILGKFNSATDGNTNGVTGWGGWENVVASPYPQDKTVVIAPSDGGTAGTPHANSVVVYVGTKTNTGSEVDKAGLTNGVLKFVNVTGNLAEIVNTTTRATNITSGTAFTLSATAATTFSRPEDGSWDPTNPNHFYFVTTDQRDDVNDAIGAQVGRTRLWRLNFTNITTPELGGTIDLVLTGGSNVPSGNDANMWDNMTVTSDGKLMLQEDVGGAAHNGKVWFYDPVTGSLTKVLKHDASRFGDRVSGVTTPATAPYTNDEETSGVIDVTALFGGNAATGDRTYLMVDQAHYTTGISTANVEGGQLLLVHQTSSVTGPTTTTAPYVLPMSFDFQVNSLLTVGDSVGGYQMVGIPDGLGAYDNGDGTLTLLMNHELGKDKGVARAHGAIGAFVSQWVINKSTLAVTSGSDLMTTVYNWNSTTQVSDTAPSTIAFSRFCSADLPPVSAFYNAATGLGTQTRIFMNGEESTGGGTNGLGYVVGHVATGADKGKSYILGKFNSATDGNTNGVTGWGGWENVVASPYPQDKTVVIAPSDGGTAGTPHANSVVVYVGTKTNTGSEVDKAGLTNGVLKFVNVTGNPAEIVNSTTRATNITSGTAFTLSATAATTFSRPEDGSWDPTHPNHFYFVTTDQIDRVNDGIGPQIGRTRLWRLNFTNITTPELGGTFDLVLTGGVGNDANMWDNMTVTDDGKLMLQEDVGGAPHNGKVWFYDPATGSFTKVLQHNPALFGDLTTPATAPYTNDEETSGVIDVSAIFGSNAAAGQRTYFMVDQAHYPTGNTTTVEGGQLLLVRQTPKIAFSLSVATNTVTENAGNLVLTVKRYGDLQFPATVNVSTSSGTAIAGTDFTGLSSFAVNFAPGETTKTVNVAITNRAGTQPDRSFTASLSAVALGSPSTTTVTIMDTTSAAFAAWLAANGYTGVLGGDTDNDGIPDVLEYFFNANPNNGGDRDNLPQLVINGSDLEFRFTYLGSTVFPGYLRCSTDLVNWVNAVPGIDYELISETVNGVETAVRFRIFCNPTPTTNGPFTYLTPFTEEVERGSINNLTITNHGMVGAGRITGEALDSFGETMGASSGLSITNWGYNSGSGQFSGTFNVLPDRGYNSGAIFSNYAARIHRVPFTFVPYYGAGPVVQNQIVPTYLDTTKFTYLDGTTTKFTTGLNAVAVNSIMGQSVGTAPAANGPAGATENLISFDAEALHVFPDGSGFVSDEYGAYIARFNSSKQFTKLIQLPASAQPHRPVGTLNFDAVTAPTNGRRNNQGLEGLSVSPDNSRLFALLQSATVQDTSGSQQQTRFNTRLFVYDIAGANLENPMLIGEYAVQLPRYKINGNGAAADATAAQSEIVALSNNQFLMLPRDGNGLGKSDNNPPVAKTVDLVDFSAATNLVGLYDAEGNQISPAGTLRSTITPATSTVVINLLSSADLAKFGFNTNTASPNQFTVNEKIEGMSLVPDTSTASPEDYFLFVANDNDFQSSDVKMLDASGNIVSYGDARSSVSGSPKITNDALFTAWRITICPENRKFFQIEVNTAP